MKSIETTRHLVVHLCVLIGNLAYLVDTHTPPDCDWKASGAYTWNFSRILAKILCVLNKTAVLLDLNLTRAVLNKIALVNGVKYPIKDSFVSISFSWNLLPASNQALTLFSLQFHFRSFHREMLINQLKKSLGNTFRQ